ncbi:MAG: bis(5'-nucleosyl)-tetraphosphatase (symmetrical) YqeK [Negativicutes bacterium]|nr:bis(5'-nucleosyl)-tetraphosphatase (symmetrical) YqeK [Negativicutes bacterium]
MTSDNQVQNEFLERVKDRVKERLSWPRFRHSLGVLVFAVRLADRWGADRNKAMLAAMVHDYARELGREKLISIAGRLRIHLDKWERQSAGLMHARVGAALVREELAIEDQEILSAVARHTTGSPNMSLLDKVIFLADSLEPGREFDGVDRLRQLAERDIDKATLFTLDRSIAYVLEKKGEFLHPATVAARNYLLEQLRLEFLRQTKAARKGRKTGG